EVFRAWERKDRIATDILAAAANSLARDAVTCAKRLSQSRKSSKGKSVRGSSKQVEFVLAGSVLLKQPFFTTLVSRNVRKLWPSAIVRPLERDSVWGAVELARKFAAPKIAEGFKAGRHA